MKRGLGPRQRDRYWSLRASEKAGCPLGADLWRAAMILAHLDLRRMILLVEGPARELIALSVSVQLHCNPLYGAEPGLGAGFPRA
jgi:hypothetical protein